MKKSELDITWTRDVDNIYSDNGYLLDNDRYLYVGCRFTNVLGNVAFTPYWSARNHGIVGVFVI